MIISSVVYGDPKSLLSQTELLKGPSLSEAKMHEDLMSRSKNQRMVNENQRQVETISPVNIETINVFPTPKHAAPNIHVSIQHSSILKYSDCLRSSMSRIVGIVAEKLVRRVVVAM